jgi:hypothetical protein
MGEVETEANVSSFRWHLAAERVQRSAGRVADLLRVKYDPGQPRVPAGAPEGGQWTDSAGGSGESEYSAEPERPGGSAGQITVAVRRLSPTRAAECERQYDRDILVCNMARSPSCYAQAMVRLVACQQGGSIPPLSF